MMQGPQTTSPQIIGMQPANPQNPGMIMPNAMTAKPNGESTTR